MYPAHIAGYGQFEASDKNDARCSRRDQQSIICHRYYQFLHSSSSRKLLSLLLPLTVLFFVILVAGLLSLIPIEHGRF
jgi:hypothetical protein